MSAKPFVVIDRMYMLGAGCTCGQTYQREAPTRHACLTTLGLEGWSITLHRNGDPTVICPDCQEETAKAKADKAAILKATREQRDAALKAYADAMLTARAKPVPEQEAPPCPKD